MPARIPSRDPNFESLFVEYGIIIKQAPLSVYIRFDEGYGPRKVYGQTTEELNNHVSFDYTGWYLTYGLILLPFFERT